LTCQIKDFDHVVLQQIDTRMSRTVAKALNLTQEQLALAGSVVTNIGDCGAAHVFLGLNAVLEHAKPGEKILVASYGTGSSDALSIKVNEALEEKRQKYPTRGRGCLYSQYLASSQQINYTTFLQHIGFLQRLDKNLMHLSVPPVSPFIWRSYKEFLQLIAAECSNCGYANFPPSQRKICVRCGNTQFKPYQMARTGTIETYTINHYMPAPLEYPLPLVVVALDDGKGKFVAQGTEWNVDKVGIGMPVELVVRILDKSRGATVYANRARAL
jgi:hydroxymethylglutaryl-CoA synthase